MKNKSEIITAYGTFQVTKSCPAQKDTPIIVFLHGFPDDSNVWDYQVEALKPQFETWVPDLYQHSFQDQKKGMVSQLESQAVGRQVILVGHDMGGPLASEIAREHPELVSKLLLINTLSIRQFIGRWKRPGQWIKSLYIPVFAGPLYETNWWKPAGKLLLKKAYDKGGLDKDDPIRNNSLNVLEGIDRYRELAKELPKHVLEMGLKLRTETHFLFGMNDPFLETPDIDELTRHYTNVSLELLPTGHWPQRTCAMEVNNWIKKVING